MGVVAGGTRSKPGLKSVGWTGLHRALGDLLECAVAAHAHATTTTGLLFTLFGKHACGAQGRSRGPLIPWAERKAKRSALSRIGVTKARLSPDAFASRA